MHQHRCFTPSFAVSTTFTGLINALVKTLSLNSNGHTALGDNQRRFQVSQLGYSLDGIITSQISPLTFIHHCHTFDKRPSNTSALLYPHGDNIALYTPPLYPSIM